MRALFPLPHGGKKQLIGRWNALLHQMEVGLDVHFQILDDLITRYGEPQRIYHNLTHLCTLFSLLPQSPPALEFAIWFHDAVYDPTRSDNEEQSALLAAQRLGQLGFEQKLIQEVEAMVRATQTHQSQDPQTLLFLDADLAVLGSSEKVYAAYTLAIRQEYGWMPEEVFRAGRIGVLERFTQRPQIYRTAQFAHLEAPARANLHHELEQLQS